MFTGKKIFLDIENGDYVSSRNSLQGKKMIFSEQLAKPLSFDWIYLPTAGGKLVVFSDRR